MQFIKILSVTKDAVEDQFVVEAEFEENDEITIGVYGLVNGDVTGLAPEIRGAVALWIEAGKPVAPFQADVGQIYHSLNKIQFAAIIGILGISIDQIETAINAGISDPTEQIIAKAKLNNAPVFHRDAPLFRLLAPILGIKDDDLNAAWLTAQEIK